MDELENYFLLHNKYWISGNDNINLLFWGKHEEKHIVPKMITINVAINYIPKHADCFELHNYILMKQKVDKTFAKLMDWAKQSFSSIDLPIYVLGYPKLSEFQTDDWYSSENAFPLDDVLFYFEGLQCEPSGTMLGKHLRARIHEIVGVNDNDIGTTKAKNKTIHDYFMFWSRSYLSPSIIKFDCDGLFFANGKTAIVEIKRSALPPIPRWCPYLNDGANYQMQASFAKAIGAKTFLLHHEGLTEQNTKKYYDGSEKVDFYDYNYADAEKFNTARRQNKKLSEYLDCNAVYKDITVSELESLILKSFQGDSNA